MGRINVTRQIQAPASRVWEVLADFGKIHRFHPHLDASPIVGPRDRGLGARRCCEFDDGTKIDEEVISWHEGEGYTVRITGKRLPFNWAEAGLSVEKAEDGTSHAHMSLDYRMRFGWLGGLLNALFLRYRLKSMFGEVIAGLDHYVTTGEIVSASATGHRKAQAASAAPRMTPAAEH